MSERVTRATKPRTARRAPVVELTCARAVYAFVALAAAPSPREVAASVWDGPGNFRFRVELTFDRIADLQEWMVLLTGKRSTKKPSTGAAGETLVFHECPDYGSSTYITMWAHEKITSDPANVLDAETRGELQRVVGTAEDCYPDAGEDPVDEPTTPPAPAHHRTAAGSVLERGGG